MSEDARSVNRVAVTSSQFNATPPLRGLGFAPPLPNVPSAASNMLTLHGRTLSGGRLGDGAIDDNVEGRQSRTAGETFPLGYDSGHASALLGPQLFGAFGVSGVGGAFKVASFGRPNTSGNCASSSVGLGGTGSGGKNSGGRPLARASSANAIAGSSVRIGGVGSDNGAAPRCVGAVFDGRRSTQMVGAVSNLPPHDVAALVDDRFKFLQKFSKVHFVQGGLIMSEVEDCLLAYRTTALREREPDRLHLDRCELNRCPYLENESNLRLLNYQSNAISRIENLNGLDDLVFLDLYDNRIRHIQNLEPVSNLRVLMLGKNEVRRIENLDSLQKLDVLDLHSNQVEKVECLDHLRDLRVLNLAGNFLRDVLDVGNLSSLTELNVRRNAITHAEGLERLLNLQRLFASHNRIATFDGVLPLREIPCLTELALDGNAVSKVPHYRTRVLHICLALEHLDSQKVTSAGKQVDGLHDQKEHERCVIGQTCPETEADSFAVGGDVANNVAREGFAVATEVKPSQVAESCTIAGTTKDPPMVGASSVEFASDCAADLSFSDSRRRKLLTDVKQSNEADVNPVSVPNTSVALSISLSEAVAGTDSTVVKNSFRAKASEEVAANKIGPVSAAKCDSEGDDNDGNAGAWSRDMRVDDAGGSGSTSVRADATSATIVTGSSSGPANMPAPQRPSSAASGRPSVPSCRERTRDRSRGGPQKMYSSQEVLVEISTQWWQALEEGRIPAPRYGYVRREHPQELAVYGRGLDALDKPEYQNVVSSIHFNYITAESVLCDMSRLARFQGLRTLLFSRNQIFSLDQLEPLRQIPALRSLAVVENPVCELRGALRLNVIRILPQLESFNGRAVRPIERDNSARIFEHLDRAAAVKNPLFHGTRCGSVGGDLHAENSEKVAAVVDGLVSHACCVAQRICTVHDHFEAAVRSVVEEVWQEVLAMERCDAHR
eukprot:TRINITY_DN74692_c0_g1_i1.p1 TRINITY_DN74692_c0_g1~~TRINITY_DN74692_c0_g1_i1.p1  ORF type:complete len:949 (-),score=139.94 TRINITY_DN74692_c0_g1_i1:383-3229(-)